VSYSDHVASVVRR